MKLRFLRSLTFLLALLAVSAAAQSVDLFAGVNTLLASQPASAPSVSGGIAPSVGMDVMFNRRIGIGGEAFWQGGQLGKLAGIPIRPIFYDGYVVWKPWIHPASSRFPGSELELQAGFGAQNIWSNPGSGYCGTPGGCTTYVPTTHFLGMLGAGWRTYLSRRVFLRTDFDAYFVRNNFEFSANPVFRIGVSLGYTFGKR